MFIKICIQSTSIISRHSSQALEHRSMTSLLLQGRGRTGVLQQGCGLDSGVVAAPGGAPVAERPEGQRALVDAAGDLRARVLRRGQRQRRGS